MRLRYLGDARTPPALASGAVVRPARSFASVATGPHGRESMRASSSPFYGRTVPESNRYDAG